MGESSVGIIGGADGPTAVLVSGNPIPEWILALAIVCLAIAAAAAAVAVIRRKRK